MRPIEDLRVGDLVLAGDPQTGQTSAQVVITPLMSTGGKRLIALRFDGDVEAVVATDNHPYWVQDQGWVAAGDLVVGDTTVGSDGSERVLAQISDLGVFANQTVHNLHVDSTRTTSLRTRAGWTSWSTTRSPRRATSPRGATQATSWWTMESE